MTSMICSSSIVHAETRLASYGDAGDSRGPVDLTVCSQNLHNYGSLADSKIKIQFLNAEKQRLREDALVSRFAKTGCDVIALQELLGKTEEDAKKALDHLGQLLHEVTNRTFVSVVGPPGDALLTMAFLVAKDRADVVNVASYDGVELPKLVAKQKPRSFSRGPLELQIIARARQTDYPKTITLVNFHLKSKHGGKADPAALEWETYRMEMAEGLRRIVENRHRRSFASGEQILMLLGDRNSNFDVASARIIEGTVTLQSFQDEGAPCRLSKRGVPLCKAETTFPQRLFSVLTGSRATKSFPGTFSYKDVYSWLDDIIMPAESLPYAWITDTSEANYNSGVVYRPKEASDHAMVYVKLNW